ncbi:MULTISPECIES: hypothetical protein [Persephonella]|nr:MULTISPECIES: hypothetical protein [Persephonella]
MKRTQIYLDEDIYNYLKAESKKNGKNYIRNYKRKAQSRNKPD